ncbi:MAG: hypothetical protein ACLR2G_13250 [Phascolarctobacterium faecium]
MWNIGDVIIFMPPLVSTVQQIEEMLVYWNKQCRKFWLICIVTLNF